MDLRTQLGFQKPMKCKFSALMLRFGTNHTLSGSHSTNHTTRVSKTYEMQVFCINVKVWNKSHIVWEPFYKSHMLRFGMNHASTLDTMYDRCMLGLL